MLLLLTALLAASAAPATLSTDWQPANRARLEAWLAAIPSAPGRKVAAFDWDNTMIKNDVGDAVFFDMLVHARVRAPKTWASTSRHLTAPAIEALESTCRVNGGFLQTGEAPCADLMLSIYQDGRTSAGKAAWKSDYDPERFEPGYAWAVQLTQGYTPDELRSLAKEVIETSLAAPLGARQRVGSREVTGYLRLYEPMKKLVAAAAQAGVEVWIVSASGQYAVETFARYAGVPPERVVGIRPILDAQGRVTPGLSGCGPYADGNQAIITYKQGKRCWINLAIFAEKEPAAMLSKPSPLAFAAGDADTDLVMVGDAALRVVVNRNKPKITCAALANVDGNWLLQPMFLAPVPLEVDCAR